MDRRLAAILCCVMLALTACGGKKDQSGEAPAEEASAASTAEMQAVEKYTPAVHEEGKYYVGIIQQSGHEALSLASRGFQDHLSELMGEDVVIDYQVADGSEASCDVIIDHFLQDKDDLILAVGTTALRQAYAATKDTPIVGAAVTDFIIAGGVSSVNEPGANVTGISDLPPMESQRDYLMEVADGGRIGIVSCSEEVNSAFQIKVLTQYLDDADADYGEYTFKDTSELEAVLGKACDECGTIFLPTDNILAANMDIVKRVSLQKGTKVFASDESMCREGALAAYGVDYYELGKRTADMAGDICIYGIDKADDYNNEDDEADDYEDRGEISKISIDRVRDTAGCYYNPVIAEKLGWTPGGAFTALEVEETSNEASTGGR